MPAPRNSTPAALISDCADAAELQKPIAKSSTYLILAHSGIGVAAPAKAIKMTTESKTIQTAYVEIWSDTDLDMLEANNARFPHALFDQDENVRNGKAKTVWYDNEAWNSNGLGDLDERAAHWSSTFAAMTWAKDGKLEQRTSWQDVFNNHSANMLGIMEFIKDGEKLVSLRVHEIPGSGVSLQAQGK